MDIRLGLCCINTELQGCKPSIFCSRTMIRKNFTVEKAKDLSIQNIKDIRTLIEWNISHGIHHLRLSSDIFPHYTDLEVESYTLDFAKDLLRDLGTYVRQVGHRITMHPGQYNQIAAKESTVFDSTVRDLSMHADILDMMGLDYSAILCIHMGGVYGSKSETMDRWVKQFRELPKKVQRRLALENCERGYSLRDCLTVANKCGIPVIYDTHHYTCYTILHPDEVQEPIDTLLPEVIRTWGYRRPIMHISEQAEGKRIGAHSDYIEVIPDHLMSLQGIDIEVEAKEKEKAILKLFNKYPQLSGRTIEMNPVYRVRSDGSLDTEYIPTSKQRQYILGIQLYTMYTRSQDPRIGEYYLRVKSIFDT